MGSSEYGRNGTLMASQSSGEMPASYTAIFKNRPSGGSSNQTEATKNTWGSEAGPLAVVGLRLLPVVGDRPHRAHSTIGVAPIDGPGMAPGQDGDT